MNTLNSIKAMESSYNVHEHESKHFKMKQLVSAILEYLQTRSEDIAVVINRCLQALSATIDLSIFDPHTNIAAEFFVSLYELMNKTEQKSQFTWNCVNVLSNACRNPAARHALIHTYQFIPSLSRLLGDQLTLEKKIRLLKLMQDLSCGIKISWQIPHLPHLLATLTKWVESDNAEIVTLALGVLVNLCYKNLPAIYTLSRNVDIKKFIRFCMPLEGPIIEVHTCKLLIILDYMNGDIPTNALIKLIVATFMSIIEAYTARDPILLRQIVEFFLDVKAQNRESETLIHFQDYPEHLKNLFAVVDNSVPYNSGENLTAHDPECMALILEFLHTLVELNLPSIVPFYPTILKLALNWIQTDIVSSPALAILRTIAINHTDKTLLEPLILGLPIYILTLNTGKGEEMPTHIEHNKKIGSLLQLLRAMIQVDSIRDRVAMELTEESIYKVFVPLLGDDSSPRLRANDVDTCCTEAVNLYVYAIALVNELAKHDKKWISLQSSLLQNKQIHMVLAQGLYNSPKEVKHIILEMNIIEEFPSELVSEAMCSLQSMIQVGSRSSKNQNTISDLHFPALSVAQIARLDEVLSSVKDVISEKRIANISTSDVMELYEYKLASMGHAERSAMASVEAASERCTHLQHHTAQLSAELNRLHQLLFHTQQCHEQAVKTKESLLEKHKELSNRLEAEKGRNVACQSQLKHKEKEFRECEEKLKETTAELKETTITKNKLEEQDNKLKQLVAKLEEKCKTLERINLKLDDSVKKSNINIDNLKTQVNALQSNVKQLDTELLKRNNELEEVHKELLARKQILDTITRVASTRIS